MLSPACQSRRAGRLRHDLHDDKKRLQPGLVSALLGGIDVVAGEVDGVEILMVLNACEAVSLFAE